MTRREMTLFVMGALTALVFMSVTGANAASRTLFRGAIVMVPAGKACPSGWATVTELNDRFPVGGTAAASGGSPSHSHSVPSHTHTVSSHSHTAPSHAHSIASHTHSVPSHTHSVSLTTTGALDDSLYGYFDINYQETTSSTSGYHDHDVTGETASGGSGTSGSGGSGTSGSAGSDSTSPNTPITVGTATNTTATDSTLPPYYTVRFCKSG